MFSRVRIVRFVGPISDFHLVLDVRKILVLLGSAGVKQCPLILRIRGHRMVGPTRMSWTAAKCRRGFVRRGVP